MTVHADHQSTAIHFKLTGAPDVESNRGYPTVSDRATVHVYEGIVWVWVEGRAILRDGTVGKGRRGVGFDLAGRTLGGRSWRPAPDWVIQSIAVHAAVRPYIDALGGICR